MENIKSQMWTSCEEETEIIKKNNIKNNIIKILGIIYILIGSINLGLIINFFKTLQKI